MENVLLLLYRLITEQSNMKSTCQSVRFIFITCRLIQQWVLFPSCSIHEQFDIVDSLSGVWADLLVTGHLVVVAGLSLITRDLFILSYVHLCP